jgi:hypothetical protein
MNTGFVSVLPTRCRVQGVEHVSHVAGAVAKVSTLSALLTERSALEGAEWRGGNETYVLVRLYGGVPGKVMLMVWLAFT